MNITLKRIGMLSLLAMALPAQAHKLWLLPSHTSVSELSPWPNPVIF